MKLSDLPLDDPAMKKVMDNLDHLVTDHITTYILKEDIDSYEYQEIFDSPAVIPALKNMFARDRLLVASRSTGAGAPTVNEMRAIFSYYIFTSLIDWRSLSERERQGNCRPDTCSWISRLMAYGILVRIYCWQQNCGPKADIFPTNRKI